MIGVYVAGDSAVHRARPGVKLAVLLAATTALLLAARWEVVTAGALIVVAVGLWAGLGLRGLGRLVWPLRWIVVAGCVAVGAAVIVGSRTTGKGNFQNAFRLSDGSLLNISIGKYYTPNGVSLTETGITPDIELDLSEEEYAKLYTKTLEKSDDPQLQAAIRALGENIS